MTQENMKKKKSGLIPFSLDEVKVGDTIIMCYRYRRKVIEKKLSRKHPLKLKNIDGNFRDGMEMYSYCEGTYIDRRPRYKRILHSLLGITM